MRAKTEPGKGESTTSTTEKTAAGKSGGEDCVKNSACRPPDRASMNGGLLARSRLKYDITRGLQYIEIPLPLIQASRVQN